MRIALKVDVDTYRGTREDMPRLADLLGSLSCAATFLLSLGPDHTGRAIKRVFRRGFLRKVQRTSVLEHYGLRTLLYGTLLPGPHIGRRCAVQMRDLRTRSFEVGVHTWDHVRWQDGVAQRDAAWARREMRQALSEFADIFGTPAQVHGAAGWQVNGAVPALEQELGIRYASDTRGSEPFMPVIAGLEISVPQLPTTLPTLDELIGRTDLLAADPVEHLLALTDAEPARDHIFTLHAELEGRAYRASFERLLRSWRDRGVVFEDLAGAAMRLDPARLPRAGIVPGEVPGRSGVLAVQDST